MWKLDRNAVRPIIQKESRLSPSLGKPVVAAPLEAEQLSHEPASGRSDRLTADPTNGRTAGQADGSSHLKFAMSWDTDLWPCG